MQTLNPIVMPDRSIAPALAPFTVPRLLPYHRFFLPNGMEVVYMNDPSQEAFKIDLVFEAGVCYQPRPLVANTAIQMLNEGTSLHTAAEIADLFDYYGAYVDFNCGLNKSEFSLLSLNKYADETIGMMAEMVAESTIPEQELDILLANKRQEFLVNREKTAYLARKRMAALLFGEEHPYANLVRETDFRQVGAEDIRRFCRERLTARHCRLHVCGKADEEIRRLIGKHFGGITAPNAPAGEAARPFRPAAPGRCHVEKENAVQTSIRIGKTGVRLTDRDYAAFRLLDTILGGYFGSRLMSNLREEKGYTYGVQSFNVSMPQGSYWCVTTDVNACHTEAAIAEILHEIERLRTEEVPEEELRLVRRFLHGTLLREVDGIFSQSDSLKNKLNYGLDNGIYSRLIESIHRTTPAELRQLARKYWNPEEMYIVTAGTISKNS